MKTTFERLRAILLKDYKLAPASLTFDAPLERLGIDSLGAAGALECVLSLLAMQHAVALPTMHL